MEEKHVLLVGSWMNQLDKLKISIRDIWSLEDARRDGYLPPNRAHMFSGVIDSRRAQRMRWSGGRDRSKVGSDEHLAAVGWLVLRADLMEYGIVCHDSKRHD